MNSADVLKVCICHPSMVHGFCFFLDFSICYEQFSVCDRRHPAIFGKTFLSLETATGSKSFVKFIQAFSYFSTVQ